MDISKQCDGCIHYEPMFRPADDGRDGTEWIETGTGACDMTHIIVQGGDICEMWARKESEDCACENCTHYHHKADTHGTCGLNAWATDGRCWCDHWDEKEKAQ